MNLIDIAKETAVSAGSILKKGFGTSFKIDTKEGKQNLVTEYDRASQDWIILQIKKAFPNHTFLAEEGDIKETPSDEIHWIIDPLDGTVNFAHEVPFFAVSIAAAKGSEILCGCVYNPMLDELFYAEKDAGAHLGSRKLTVTDRTSLDTALAATGFPYNAYENPHRCIDRFGKMVKKGLPIRRLGVAALDMCYVAAGRFDLFWEEGLHPWDMAAGKLIVEEAGGQVSHYDGSPHKIFPYSSIIATNGHLHKEMVSLLKEDLI